MKVRFKEESLLRALRQIGFPRGGNWMTVTWSWFRLIVQYALV
jgi:hypothetical protein